MLGSQAALPERERVHAEERQIALLRLDDDDVAAEARVFLELAQAVLQTRMEERAEHLVQDGEQAARGQRHAVEGVVAVAGETRNHAVVDRAERVVAEHELRAVLDRHVDVGGASHAAVDVVDAANARGLVEAGQQRFAVVAAVVFRQRDLLDHFAVGRIVLANVGLRLPARDRLGHRDAQELEIVRQLVPLDVLAQIDLER